MICKFFYMIVNISYSQWWIMILENNYKSTSLFPLFNILKYILRGLLCFFNCIFQTGFRPFSHFLRTKITDSDIQIIQLNWVVHISLQCKVWKFIDTYVTKLWSKRLVKIWYTSSLFVFYSKVLFKRSLKRSLNLFILHYQRKKTMLW